MTGVQRPDVLLVAPLTVGVGRVNSAGSSSLEDAPLGILSLAAVLDALEYRVQVMELDVEYGRTGGGDFAASIAHRIARSAASVVGFGSICNSYPLTLRIIQELRQIRPDAFIILGGPQASVTDIATLRAFDGVQVVVRGEAEKTLPMLLEAHCARNPFDLIPGISFRRGDTIIRNPNAEPVNDLDGLPLPAYRLLDYRVPAPVASLELGRGCPFACRFCSTNDFFRRRFRLKSPEVVLRQMYLLAEKYRSTSFCLVHDMFTVDRRAVLEFCKTLWVANQPFKWTCSARTDCVDEEMLDRMAEAGCNGIFFGIETGSQRMQGIIQKNLNIGDAMRIVRAATNRRIGVTVSLITAFPMETAADFGDTVDFLLRAGASDIADPQLHLLSPLASTPLETEYRSRLTLDKSVSDISGKGSDEAEDWALIERYPEIFSSFYAFPLEHLDRSKLVMARSFLLNGLTRMRWLMLALHTAAGHIGNCIEAWASGLPELRDPPYFRSGQFDLDLVAFAEREFPAVRAVTNFYRRLQEAYSVRCEPRNAVTLEARNINSRSVPVLAPETFVLEADFNVAILFEDLRRGEIPHSGEQKGAHFIIRKGKRGNLDVLSSSPLLICMMQLFDGQRTLAELASKIDWDSSLLESLPALQIMILAAAQLQSEGLIRFAEELESPTPQPLLATHAGASVSAA